MSAEQQFRHAVDLAKLAVGIFLGLILWIAAPLAVGAWAFVAGDRRGKWELLTGSVLGAAVPTVAVWFGFLR